MQTLIARIRSFDGVLVVQPEAGSDLPDISWGDSVFYYAPDGVMPTRRQPYGTIVTKDHPDDTASNLNGPGRFRVNIDVGRERARELACAGDPARSDVIVPHPLHASAGWVSVVNLDHTAELVLTLLGEAHEAARSRAARCAAVDDDRRR